MLFRSYVVTEAGFGADLGAEKFFNIKCRKAGLVPDAVVLVATVRALKHQGGVAKDDLNIENTEALFKGCINLGRHIRNLSQFGVPLVVGINKFVSDTEAEFQVIRDYCEQFNVEVSVTSHWEHGGDGAIDLANDVENIADGIFSPLEGFLNQQNFESVISKGRLVNDTAWTIPIDRKSTRLNSSHT